MLKRDITPDFDLLNTYDATIALLKVKGFPYLKPPNKYMVLSHTKENDKVANTVTNTSVPKNAKIHKVNDDYLIKLSQGSVDEYWKCQPKDVPAQIDYMYAGHSHHQAKVLSVNKMRDSRVFSFLFGSYNPKGEEGNSAPIYTWKKKGITIDFYRVLNARYDLMRNDYYMELVIKVPKLGLENRIWIPIPITSWRILEVEDRSTQYWELFFSKMLDTWHASAKNPADLRTKALLYWTGCRYDRDFPDKSTYKWAQFLRLKKMYISLENLIGYTPLTVWLATMLWVESNPTTLHDFQVMMYGEKAKKFNGYMAAWSEEMQQAWPLG